MTLSTRDFIPYGKFAGRDIIYVPRRYLRYVYDSHLKLLFDSEYDAFNDAFVELMDRLGLGTPEFEANARLNYENCFKEY